MAVKGLYFWLKDPGIPLGDRLKVARFAWVSDRISLPNKHQVLLDLITGFLVNRKKLHLSDQTCGEVWCCLDRLLACPVPVKDPPILKPSFCQVVLDALHTCLNEPGETCQSVASCCASILSSPALADTFARRFDFLTHLLSLLSQLGAKQLGQDGKLALYDVICQVADALWQCQRSQTNVKQVLQTTLDQLLIPLLALRCLATNSKLSQQATDILVNKVEAILTSALLSRDQTPYYTAFLMAVAVETETEKGAGTTRAKAGKLTETFFNSLADLLDGTVPSKFAVLGKLKWREAARSFLPVFFQEFASTVSRDVQLCYKMLVTLCRMLALVSKDSGGPGDGCHGDGDLATLQGMLEVVQRQELYNVADDNASGFQLLHFFRSLTDSLLGFPRTAPCLVECFLELLNLNHAILEPKMAAILQMTWLLPLSDQSHMGLREADRFLTELVSTYAKLRQVPKLVAVFLSAVRESSLPCRTSPAACFYHRFGEVVSLLPLTSFLDVWQSLLEESVSVYLPQLQHGACKTAVAGLQCLCSLFEKVLQSLRVTSDTLTSPTAARVSELMNRMESELLRPLFESVLQNKEEVPLFAVCLLLAYRWGELRIPLALYGRGRASITVEPALVSHPSDLSLVLPLLTAKQWSRLHRRLCRSESAQLLYLWDLLSVQKMHAASLFVSDRSTREATLTNVAEVLLQSMEVENPSALAARWDGLVCSVNEETYLVAKWSLLTSHWAQLAPMAGQEHLAAVCDLAVRSLSPASLGNQNRESRDEGGVTCADVTQRFLSSTALEGTPDLFSGLVSALWRLVAMETTSTPSKGKKKLKRSPASTLVHQIWQLLSQNNDLCQQDTEEPTVLALQEAGNAVSRLLEMSPVPDVGFSDQLLDTMLQVLRSVHFECLGRGDQLRCILGLLAAVVTLTSGQAWGQGGVSGVTGALGQLQDLLVGSHAPLFHHVTPPPLLAWLLRLLSKVSGGSSLSHLSEQVRGLVQTVCQTLTWDVEALRQAKSFVDQLSKHLATENCSKRKKRLKKEEESDDLSDDSRLALTACLLQQFSKSLSRNYLPAGVKEICREYFQALANPLTQRLTSLTFRGDPPTPWMVSCAETLLCHHRPSPSSPPHPAPLVLSVFQRVVGHLEAVSDEWTDEVAFCGDEGIVTCLQFVQTMFLRRVIPTSSLPPDALSRCWNASQNLLTRLVQSQTSLPATLDLQTWSGNGLHGEILDESCSELLCGDVVSDLERNGGALSDDRVLSVREESGVSKSSRSAGSLGVFSTMEPEEEKTSAEGERGWNNGESVPSETETNWSVKLLERELRKSGEDSGRNRNIILTLLREQVAHFGHSPSNGMMSKNAKVIGKSSTSFPAGALVAEVESHSSRQRALAVHGGCVDSSLGDSRRATLVERLEATLVAILTSSSAEQFCSFLASILHNVSQTGAGQSPARLLASLQVWRRLLDADLPETLLQHRIAAAKRLMQQCQHLSLALRWLPDRLVAMAMTIPLLEAQTHMLNKGRALMSSRQARLSMCSCNFLNAEGAEYESVISACHAVYDVLNALLVHHTMSVLACLPAFLHAVQKLVKVVLDYGSQERLLSSPAHLAGMVTCALLVSRLLGLLCSHRVDVAKVSTFLLAGFTATAQRHTLHPSVKRALTPGLYNLLDVCDKFGIAQLFATLPPGTREVFGVLHSDYVKYHKFQGRV